MDIRNVARIAVLIALGLTAASCAHSDESAPQVLTTRLALQDDLRQLWSSHATWTRVVIVSSVAGLDDTSVATARLQRNAAEIGDAIRPFHGDEAAYHYTALLTDHVTFTTEVIAATIAADNAALELARGYWYANADDTARFLATLSPEWEEEALRSLLRGALDQTNAEIMARVSADWEGDVAAHDGFAAEAREIADELTDGIARDFPDLVSSRIFLSATEHDLHVSMRVLWQDHAAWTRFSVIDAVEGLPSARVTTERVVQSGDEISDALRQYEGAPAANELALLLRAQVEHTNDLARAYALDDTNGAGLAESALDANARELAELYASLGEGGSVEGYSRLTTELAEHTPHQALARVRGDYEADVDAYDGVVALSLRLADTLADHIAR